MGDMNGLLGLRMGGGSGDAAGFGTSLMSELLEAAGGAAGLLNRDASIEESTVTEHSPSFWRKRRAVTASTRANDLVRSLLFLFLFFWYLCVCLSGIGIIP